MDKFETNWNCVTNLNQTEFVNFKLIDVREFHEYVITCQRFSNSRFSKCFLHSYVNAEQTHSKSL